MSERIRLDQALEQRGLLGSRARARDAVKRGTVKVNGIPASKPHQPVGPDDVLTLDDPAAQYVSRAVLKLIAGLDAAGLSDLAGSVCLDVGASTGGFTQVLLERGASKVYAVDVGHDQLHPNLRAEPRVLSFEGTNARELTRENVPDSIDLLVCDISFVSVTKVLAAPLSLCREGALAIILFKPQFEVGRDNVGRGGIVSDPNAIAEALAAMTGFVEELGWRRLHALPSPMATAKLSQSLSMIGWSEPSGSIMLSYLLTPMLVVMFLVGLILAPTPIPIGLPVMALALVLLISTNPQAANQLLLWRRRWPRLDAAFRAIEDRAGPRLGATLRRTRPPRQ
ncbi:hypothetical protein GCM10007989_27330 [Devosia pacifica]|uniref:RNA-binding S4 domain-containing protein n=1 Tax=Devosia pacifica TaxID=1335967 RepID=A0A918VWL7_9HYPH|nr:TlyA family RNA methyltransferase [Devosia pacifica]GHA30168.1 hypothetical protein GCM10007989_27330 [Devosia pacifica]